MKILDAEFAKELEKLTLVSRRLKRGRHAGVFFSRRRGRSAEFTEYRDYAEGDDTRFIDWNLYGRLEKLYLKLFLEEDDLHVRLLIDTSASMAKKFPAVLKLVAAVGYVALAGGNRVELQSLDKDGSPLTTPVLKGRNSIGRLFAFLERLETNGASTPDSLARAFCGGRTVGPGLRVVFSDFLQEGGSSGMFTHLNRRGSELFILQILSSFELSPQLPERALLRDAETLEEIKADASDELYSCYRKIVVDYCDRLRQDSAKNGAAYALLDSDDPFDEAVVGTLRSIGLLK